MSQDLTEKQKHWLTISKGLKAWEIRLIELRYIGYGFKEISKKLLEEFGEVYKFGDNMLRVQVYSGGRLKPAYDDYCEMMNLEAFEEGENVMKSAYSIATRTIIGLMQSKAFRSDDVRLRSAREVLDRVIGKPTQKIIMDDRVDDEAEKLRKLFKDLTTKKDGRVKPVAKDTKKRAKNRGRTSRPVSARKQAGR